MQSLFDKMSSYPESCQRKATLNVETSLILNKLDFIHNNTFNKSVKSQNGLNLLSTVYLH